MQYNILTENKVQASPTYIHALTSKTLVVSYTDKVYEIYSGSEIYIMTGEIAPAVCGINIGDDICLLGLDNGDGALISLRNNQMQCQIQKWRDQNYKLDISLAIIYLTRISDKQVCAVSEDGTIYILEQKSDFEVIAKQNLKFKVCCCYIDAQMSIFATGNQLLAFRNLQDAINCGNDKIKILSENQLSLFGLTKSAHQNEHWQQQCQINGTIVHLLVVKDIMYLTTDKGYFYVLKIGNLSFNIQRVLEIGQTRPIQLNLINDALLHMSCLGQQLMIYDIQTKVLHNVLHIKSDKQLLGSRIEEKDSSLLLFLVYRNKPSNFQEINPPKYFDASAQLIQMIY